MFEGQNMKKAVMSKKQAGMNKQHLYWKLADGKRYQLRVKEHNGKTEKLYELQVSTNDLERFIDEDKAVFEQMESEIDSADLDFDSLQAELDSIE